MQIGQTKKLILSCSKTKLYIRSTKNSVDLVIHAKVFLRHALHIHLAQHYFRTKSYKIFKKLKRIHKTRKTSLSYSNSNTHAEIDYIMIFLPLANKLEDWNTDASKKVFNDLHQNVLFSVFHDCYPRKKSNGKTFPV